MNLESLAAELRGFAGITRKKQIGNLMQFFPIESERIIASFGEDAAVIDDGEEVMLLAADGIWSKLMEVDPEWSGYCSVLVNVHDIAAMGGWPVAMVDVLSVDDQEMAEKVLRGMKKGIEKFNVPIIGGHLHPDTPYSALDVAILGQGEEECSDLEQHGKRGRGCGSSSRYGWQAAPQVLHKLRLHQLQRPENASHATGSDAESLARGVLSRLARTSAIQDFWGPLGCCWRRAK